MSPKTSTLKILLQDTVINCKGVNPLGDDWNFNTPIEISSDERKELKMAELTSMYILKKAANASNLLVLGLKLKEDPSSILIIHIQTTNSHSDLMSFETIKKKHKKNSLFKFTNTHLKTRNITLVLTEKEIIGIPSSLPDGLLIVDKHNFDEYFVNIEKQ